MKRHLIIWLAAAIAMLAQLPGERRVAAGWSAAESADYRATVDRATRHRGHPSLTVEFTGSTPGGYAVTQRIKADAYRGKRVRLTGFLKADQAVDGGALWLRIDFANGDYVLDNSLDFSAADKSTRDASGWTRCAIVAAVPGDALGVSFGLRMKGRGKIQASDLNFEVVPATVQTTTIERRGYKGKPGKDAAMAQLRSEFAAAPAEPLNLTFEQP